MRISKTMVYWILFLLLALPCSPLAQEKSSQDIQKSCRDFVQKFYDWYVPKTQKLSAERTWDLALKYRRSSFSAELVRRLSEDSDAQAKVAGEIVGLDFDPFLNSQDPDEHFVVGKVRTSGDSCRAEVHGVRSGKRSEEPDVVVELALKHGRWLFVNFHYEKAENPARENLLSLLKSLRENRQREPR